jgi:hypothetical protein
VATLGTPVICERVRAQISLELDGELSQFERVLVGSHVARCADCAAYRDEVSSFTELLRAAPAERMDAPVVVTKLRRSYIGRVSAVGAAAAAVLALGVATQVSDQQPSGVNSSGIQNIRYPTLGQIQNEQTLLRNVREGKRITLDGFVI